MNKVLIVDDEKEIADLVEIYLENDGYQVYKFYNGEGALNCILNKMCIRDRYLCFCGWVQNRRH